MDERLRILFVDDELGILKALERFGRNTGMETFLARSAAEALELLDRAGPLPVVVSDYRMPGMNGLELLREIGRRWPDTVGILLSGYADIPAVSQTLQENRIFRFIAKPWNREYLHQTILEATELYRTARS